MIRFSFIILLLSQFSFVVSAQNAEQFKLNRNDLPGMEQTRWDIYKESSLIGYNKGGADLYFEYGFKEVAVQNFVWETEPFKIDAYIMDSPEAAFGVFSVSRFSCRKTGEIGQWDCINPYQVQVAYGNLYLSVMAHNGTDRSMELAVKIAQKVIGKYRASNFALPSYIPSSDIKIDNSSIKLITGQLALQNNYLILDNLLKGIEGYKVWVLPFRIGEDSSELVIATFDSAEEAFTIAEKINGMDGFNVSVSGKRVKVLRNFGEAYNSELFNSILNGKT